MSIGGSFARLLLGRNIPRKKYSWKNIPDIPGPGIIIPEEKKNGLYRNKSSLSSQEYLFPEEIFLGKLGIYIPEEI